MSKQRENIDEELAEWIRRQRIFFVATAPLSAEGHVNLSPKGGDAFRILGPMDVVYQDWTGSGAETAAHLRENGRIIVMFCGFEGAARIARLHGRGRLVVKGDERFEEFEKLFPPNAGTRAFVQVTVTRISTSCGHGVPFYELKGERDFLPKWVEKQGPEGLREYRAKKNARSIDGLAAFDGI
jgi:hypothetical protein